jgi:hypothetical protein
VEIAGYLSSATRDFASCKSLVSNLGAPTVKRNKQLIRVSAFVLALP